MGTKRLLRDEHGWMIPKDGTLSRKIYGLLVQGKGTTEIASALGIKIVNSRCWPTKFATRKRSAPNGLMPTTRPRDACWPP